MSPFFAVFVLCLANCQLPFFFLWGVLLLKFGLAIAYCLVNYLFSRYTILVILTSHSFSPNCRTIGKHILKSLFLIHLMPYNIYTIVNPCSRLLLIWTCLIPMVCSVLYVLNVGLPVNGILFEVWLTWFTLSVRLNYKCGDWIFVLYSCRQSWCSQTVGCQKRRIVHTWCCCK